MSPVVDAAWIAVIPASLAVISTAIVGLAGYRNARRAAIEASHNERMREKRAAAYEDAARDVLARSARRDDNSRNPNAELFEEARKAWEPETIRVQAVLRPYASAEAWAAYRAADEASIAFWNSGAKMANARKRAMDRGLTADAEWYADPGYQSALDARRKAWAAADEADEAYPRGDQPRAGLAAPAAPAHPAVAGS